MVFVLKHTPPVKGLDTASQGSFLDVSKLLTGGPLKMMGIVCSAMRTKWHFWTEETTILEPGFPPLVCCVGKKKLELLCGSVAYRISKSSLRLIEKRRYLFLCATQHTDGPDVVGVLSQSPLRFDSFIHSLTDVDRLEQKQVGNRCDRQSHLINSPSN